MILGIDISDYQPKIDAKALKAAGVEFAFIKASDGTYSSKYFRQHAKELDDAGVIVGAYHWLQPFIPVPNQVATLEKQIAGLNVAVAAIDLEQYGLSYLNEAPIKSPAELSAITRDMLQQSRRLTAKTLLYSRATFVFSYARPVIDWIHETDLWWASYPFHPSSRITTDWETMKSTYTPSSFRPFFVNGWPTDPQKRKVKFWQFTGDRFMLPGMWDYLGRISPADVNLFDGTVNDLRAYLGLAPVVPQLTLTEKVEKLWASHPELH